MLESELRKGSAELLVLGVLREASRHGFHSATLYPTLYRLERRRLITGRWVEKPGQRRRRFYRITARGRAVLGEQQNAWTRFVQNLHRVLQVPEA
jgi:PadR family transcriptional regulator PadR